MKPLLIFKRKTVPNGDFPKSIVMWYNEKGFVNESVMIDLFQKVWKKQDGAFFCSKGLSILGSMKAHVKESITTSTKKKNIGTVLCAIHEGSMKILQPLIIV